MRRKNSRENGSALNLLAFGFESAARFFYIGVVKKYDVAVLGSGVSGMTSALLQARRGRSVVLLEQAPHLAPLISGFERKGAHFETGVHYCAGFGPGEPGTRLLERIGVSVPVRPCAPGGYGEIRLLSTGRRFPMLYGRERIIERFGEDFPGEKDNVARFLEKMRAEAAQSQFLNERKDAASAHFPTWSSRTLREELDAHFRSPEIKAIFATLTYLHGVPPDRISFSLHSHIVNGMYEAMWEFDGGGKTLAAAFRQALEREGVDILLRRRVTRLEAQGSAKLLHSADGSVVAADRCISTLHAKAFLELAPPGLYRPSSRSRAMEIPETAGFLCMYALHDGPAWDAATFFLLPDLEVSHFPSERSRSLYELHFTHTAPRTASIVALAPETGRLADRKDPLYRERKQEAVRAHWEQLSRWCPDLTRRLTLVASSTPATQMQYTGYTSGYGLMHDCFHGQILPMTKIPGIYLAGQSVVAPGILGTMISAFLSDTLIP